MNRTKGILFAAAVLTLAALLVARASTSALPDPTPVVSAGKGVSLGTAPSGRYLLAGGDGEVYLDVSLAGVLAAKIKSLPINVALVIDRSGSMAGQKLEHAKEAARTLVARLRDGDRIAIVTFGSDVSVLVASTAISSSTRPTVLEAIETIVDRGGTFLSGGLQAGRQELRRHGREGFVNRVVLLSDGQANEGITATGELETIARQTVGEGIHITTMGVGLDFNENLMTALAEHGGGHYYFMQDSRAMASIFGKELDTLLATVARGAKLAITLEPGVRLLDVFGYAYERVGGGNVITIDLPDLFSGQHRKVICKVGVPTDHEGKVAVARIELSYTDAATNERRALTTSAEVEVTRDSARVEAGRDRRVLAKAEQVNASKRLTEAMEAYGSGDVARSQALLDAQIRDTEAANAGLRSKDLDEVVTQMKRRRAGTAAAAPASPAGRALIKEGKFEAYQLNK